MEIGLKNMLSNNSGKRLSVHCGRQKKTYYRCPITNRTTQASARPLLLTHSPEHPFSLSLPGALQGLTLHPEVQESSGQPKPSHAEAREPSGQKEGWGMKHYRFGCSGSPAKYVPENAIHAGMGLTVRFAEEHVGLIVSNQQSSFPIFPF